MNSVGMKSFRAERNLLIPLIIAALIVFNTMLGAVYERTKEIGTLNAVGLAPVHIAGLFVAEAAVYAVLGGVFGYIIGQGAAKVIVELELLPGMTLNYSSLSTVATIFLIMVVVIGSAIYPARMASKLCVPGIERRWRLSEPAGDFLSLELPFTLSRRDALGLGAFLGEYFEAHEERSIGGGFYCQPPDAETSLSDEQGILNLRFTVWLSPFDMGVRQEVEILTEESDTDGIFAIRLNIRRVSGDRSYWVRGNRAFLNDIRKQFLAWRALDEEQRKLYSTT